MAFTTAFVLLVAFTANVVIGAVGEAPVVGSVAEMLILLGSTVAFVVGILQREERDRKN
ncbi:hypothetical protein KUD11_15000 [Roseovarius sp. LXJ103]|uniref:hypothetical protein n=1 Tax=Roseovarius carneus TaxID=2853164 RepID=UPI0015E8081E|nr:hypothetical protein [Roseovarius carneus]MBZ8119943.1 hypothetical protein [Roseovarius carneus]